MPDAVTPNAVTPDAVPLDVMTAETFLTILPLAIPAAVLLTLLAILLYSIRRRRRATTAVSHLIVETRMQSDDAPKSNDRPRADRDGSGEQGLASASPAAFGAAPLTAAPHTPPVQSPAAAPTPVQAAAALSASVLVERISAKEADGGTDSLAQLYLDLARAYRADGRPRDALQALQSAAGLGAMHGPKAVHALARLELGEAAFAAGDRTGACEQWQIAKMEFHEEGLREAYALTDKRMRDNGCPTDWVLTEF